MKVRALRLAAVGPFSTAVALEGFSGGLDVLAGPNEMGKSTLFRALESVFTVKHTAVGKAVEALRSRHGGEPLIEVDFEVQGGRWRMRKQFGRGRSAELVDLARGQTFARGADAETRLSELIGASDKTNGGLSLVWLGQGHSLRPVTPSPEEHGLLSALVAREIDAVAAGPEARRVRQSVEARLDELLTPKRTAPRKGGPYDLAIKEREQLATELADAARESVEAADRLDRLELLRGRLANEASPAQRAARAATLERETKIAAEAAQRVQQLATAREAERAKAMESERADEALTSFDQSVETLVSLSNEAGTAAARVAELEDETAALDQRLAAGEARLAELEQQERAAGETLQAIDLAQARSGTAKRLTDVSRRLEACRKLTGEIAEATRALAGNKATPERLDVLAGIEQELGLAAARLQASAAIVRIDYAPGGAGKVRIAGREAADGAEIAASAVLVLEVAGVGRITVRPPAGDQDAIRDEMKAHEQERERLLGEMGAAGVAEARSAAASRARAENALAAARAQLKSIAGGGVDEIAAEQTRLTGELAAMDARGAVEPESLPARAGIESHRTSLREAMARERQSLAILSRQRRDKGDALASLRAAVVARAARMADIEARLPAPAARGEERERLATAARSKRQLAAEAMREMIALREVTPSPEALAEMVRRRDEAAAALARFDADRQALALEIEKLQGRVEQADEQEAGVRAAALAGAHQRATAAVARLEDEIAALRLVLEALDTARERARAQFLAPVLARTTPYLQTVLPEAALAFEDGLAVAGLQRTGSMEPLTSLSDGTQEQIAIVVRLAFARLLADAGRAVPLVLDDALVYADDQRIARLFEALRTASAHHQVIVLTCRERSFADLGGTRLSLSGWGPG